MKVGIVNVGTIGHIDRGRTTLTAALLALAHEVVGMSEDDVRHVQEMERFECDPLLKDESPYGRPVHGRLRDPKRKTERAERMRELRRRAFEGRP